MKRRVSVGIHAVLLVTLVLFVAASSMAEPVTIRFHYRGGGARTEVVEEWIAEFEKQNPDIKVEWEIPSGSWQDKLLVSMAAGSAPDVVEFWETSPSSWGVTVGCSTFVPTLRAI